MLDERQASLLRDILDSALRIQTYLAGMNRESFGADIEKQDAVLRRLEIVGEAASHVTPDVQAQFSSLPVRDMKGMRNIIAHDYGEVDLDQVWTTIQKDIPSIIAALQNRI